ncbi:LOW QUALITY PROTEIN: E3 ubiquitin-protein ligase TRIM21-like [Xyrichtys novacula]|uniref:LOW QUALITY PROTEIN: E3 ubiquitin-protein ligase TRIM21-like n=1 Tax=Xyrichtys novacula TaxID=13765 RepID=A0AAV1F5L4_XYRNO|nr:LOW QUALITY PROTEIN: E3 ubiquitin-protein ligase TRIM21-like [Xyrichtys novacula]
MSAASCLLTEDQFLCSICLDVFTDPVTIPCGHNFCESCISKHWKTNTSCQCPNCKRVFNPKPELHVNTFISEMSAQFRQSIHVSVRMCEKHDKLLELFCKNEQMCVCMLCSVKDHRTHDVVPLREEYEGKKAELGKTEAEIPQMIQERRLKIEELKESVELSHKKADREIDEVVEVFTALKESVERSQAKLIHTIKEKQRETEEQAEGFITELQQEICELEKRSSELEQLSCSEDHLHLLQNFTTLNAAPPTKNWTEVRVHPPSYEGAVKLFEAELKRVQQCEVDVTLDPDTAHPKLLLSKDGKQVYDSDVKKNLPDNPKRFNCCVCVLAKQSLSSGRFYFEVQVKGKTEWDLGVVRESINRKVRVSLSPKNGFWTIWLRNKNEYGALADPSVRLRLRSDPEKVWVFVDYEEGLVSFYDVDAAALIYSFTACSFTGKLLPYFCPCNNNRGKNSAPLIISPVNHTE